MSAPEFGVMFTTFGSDQVVLTGTSKPAANLPPKAELVEEALWQRSGIPFPAVQGVRFSYVDATTNATATRLVKAIQPPKYLLRPQIVNQRPLLPLEPIWLGFIGNTILYALVIWAGLASLRHFSSGHRRRRRLRKGLCPWCKYPIGSSNRCSECGGELPDEALLAGPSVPVDPVQQAVQKQN